MALPWSQVVKCTMCLVLFLVSVVVHLVTKVYPSWFQQAQGLLLELNLLLLAIFTIVLEGVSMSTPTRERTGFYLITIFLTTQIIVFFISLAEVVY